MAAPSVISPKGVPVVLDEYVPQNILVTGGAGFIASHVVIRLVNCYPQYKARS